MVSRLLFFVSSGFYLRRLPWKSLLSSFFAILESFSLTLTKESEAYSALDAILGSSVTTWMSNCGALGVILVGRQLLVHHCAMLLSF